MQKTAVFPGFFDPFTAGHFDCLIRASVLFDEVVVAVAVYSSKKAVLAAEKRADLIRECIKDFKNIRVEFFEGALTDFCIKGGYATVLRGMRNINDFEYERQLGNIYKSQLPSLETLYLITSQHLSHVSSGAVRDIVAAGGNCKGYVPDPIIGSVNKYYRKEN